MTELMREIGAKALRLGVPLTVQLDLTYRCNERCVHCYLDHEDHGEMNTAEIKDVLDQLAAAGVFFLNVSGGEIFMRRDLFEIIEHARKLMFSVKLKTNAVMIRAAKAKRIAELGVHSVQISLYSHVAETHDAITKLRGSFRRTIEGARLLKEQGVDVSFANVLMKGNEGDYRDVQELARQMGIGYNVDATITPMMDGDRSVLALNIDAQTLERVFHDESVVGDAQAFCTPPSGPPEAADAFDTLPCSAGHTACYISPYGDVYPCVQFPLPCGNVRESKFIDIWRDSPQFKEVRGITVGDLQGCSSCVHGGSCTRCPGLAYMEGNMRGPSTQDCEKSYARTGVSSRHLAQRAKGDFPVTWMVAG